MVSGKTRCHSDLSATDPCFGTDCRRERTHHILLLQRLKSMNQGCRRFSIREEWGLRSRPVGIDAAICSQNRFFEVPWWQLTHLFAGVIQRGRVDDRRRLTASRTELSFSSNKVFVIFWSAYRHQTEKPLFRSKINLPFRDIIDILRYCLIYA